MSRKPSRSDIAAPNLQSPGIVVAAGFSQETLNKLKPAKGSWTSLVGRTTSGVAVAAGASTEASTASTSMGSSVSGASKLVQGIGDGCRALKSWDASGRIREGPASELLLRLEERVAQKPSFKGALTTRNRSNSNGAPSPAASLEL